LARLGIRSQTIRMGFLAPSCSQAVVLSAFVIKLLRKRWVFCRSICS